MEEKFMKAALKEAKKANASKAVFLVLTLKKEGCYSEKKVE